VGCADSCDGFLSLPAGGRTDAGGNWVGDLWLVFSALPVGSWQNVGLVLLTADLPEQAKGVSAGADMSMAAG
jgi:hypothetical protein